MLRLMLIGGLVCLSWMWAAAKAQAQVVIWGGEAERYFHPGTYVPYDGHLWQTNYGYGLDFPSLMFSNYSGNQLRNLDYADRLERAYKFGYPIPQAPAQCAPSTTLFPRLGFGGGFFWQR